MVDEGNPGPATERSSGTPGKGTGIPRLLAIGVGGIIAILVLVAAMRIIGGASMLIGDIRGRTTLTQEIVVEQVRAVAQLVSSEMTVRDVVTFENTRYGSTKRALIVVTGKILAGIDLEEGTEVRIDSAARRITIVLPEARVLAVDILQLRTYDEQRGLWNPFLPEDRDSIYRDVRRQLHATAADMGVVKRANESAARMLETMFSVDGFTAEVIIAPSAPLDGRQPVPAVPANPVR